MTQSIGMIKTFHFILLLLLVVGCAHMKPIEQPQEKVEKEKPVAVDPAQWRQGALDSLFVLQDYRPGKNSFVESPDRHAGVWTGDGYRYTLLDVEGSGSIRHIWSTRGGGEPYFDWEFYIDGEKTPSIKGTDVALIQAAENFNVPVAPANHVPLGNRDFNFYLPIPFEKSIRIDVVQRVPRFWLWFCQIDYRLNDTRLNGARLISEDNGEDLSLSYVGLPHQHRRGSSSTLERTVDDFKDVPLNPGETLTFAHLEGPAIVRELRLKWPEESNLQMIIRYEDHPDNAVNTPVDRFFGPFKGAAFYQHTPNDSSCYFPMPFKNSFDLLIRNDGDEQVKLSGKVEAEQVPAFAPSWGYFHALHQKTDNTNGHRLHQVLYLRGQGHWVGMTLYKTGHDHGGGDFAVIDGEGDNPAYLHGINGEDYFTFAWFGKGAHHPYAVAHTNDEGRYRHHLENVYPFKESIAIEWGAFADLNPESVVVWYQDTPADTTLADGARSESTEWDVFGPVPIPHDNVGNATVECFSVLPSVDELDEGKEYECRLLNETFTAGWMKEWSVGPMLNLTYIGRHKTKIAGEIELGGNGHAFLARRFVDSDKAKTIECVFAHDDPIEVWINNECVFKGGQHFNGFETTSFPIPLKQGKNEIVVRLTNYFNRNFNWTGFLMRFNE